MTDEGNARRHTVGLLNVGRSAPKDERIEAYAARSRSVGPVLVVGSAGRELEYRSRCYHSNLLVADLSYVALERRHRANQ